jgi:peptidoglycan/xylan/chitin deacetylase (PgdA/CDA1 family)
MPKAGAPFSKSGAPNFVDSDVMGVSRSAVIPIASNSLARGGCSCKGAVVLGFIGFVVFGTGAGNTSAQSAFGDTALLAQCWRPQELAARASEERQVRGDHRFDAPPPTQALATYVPVPAHLRGSIRRVKLPVGKKLVALTFDFCESPGQISGYDGAIINLLRAQGVPATLFVGGKWMRSHAERTAQLMADPLFELANHAEAHRNLRKLSGAALVREIEGPQSAYEAAREGLAQRACVAAMPDTMPAIPSRMTLFRFPYGACNSAALDAIHDRGLLAIQWDVSSGDSTPSVSASAMARSLTARIRPGSIVLAHANGRGVHTAAAMRILIPKLRELGYQFVTVSELLAQGTPEISATCYDSRPGDTDHYDGPAVLKAPARPTPATSKIEDAP